MKAIGFFVVFLSVFLLSCERNSLDAQSIPDNIDISGGEYGVIDLPSSVPSSFQNDGFVKYTKIQCPNGEAIHFFAQSELSIAQIVRSRTLLEFYLKDVPGSQYGSDKTSVMNTMGTNNAILLLINGSDNGQNEPSVQGQWLFQEEIAVEGHAWFQQCNYEHRDAAFEEILHLMHDMGIGVDGSNSISNPALPAYQSEIRAAQENAETNNFAIWPIGAGGGNPDIQSWYNELSTENSLSQEYLASVIDSYYGLWDAFTEDTEHGMWGFYIANDRDEVELEDPQGFAVVEMYFSPVIDVDMIIDESFSGEFSLAYDASVPYTSKSRYLQHVYLTGSNDSDLSGNDLYNRLKGNSGDNQLKGLKGNDRLDGLSGEDVAVFSGNYEDYTLTGMGEYAVIADGVNDRDGVDTLWNIEMLQFADQQIPLNLQSINQQGNKAYFTISPNPATDVVSLNVETLSVTKDKLKLQLYSETGVLMFSYMLDGLHGEKSFEIKLPENISAGTYIIQLIGETGLVDSQRLVVQ